MKPLSLWLAAVFAIVVVGSHVMAAKPPVNVIFDTDMGSDCDDVGALFVLHGAVGRGDANLLATMGCVSADAIAPCLCRMRQAHRRIVHSSRRR